jgi:hypothetical protein
MLPVNCTAEFFCKSCLDNRLEELWQQVLDFTRLWEHF